MTSRTWANGPSGHTPITAAAMMGIEGDLDTALAVPDTALAARVNDPASQANAAVKTQAAGISAALSIVFGG